MICPMRSIGFAPAQSVGQVRVPISFAPPMDSQCPRQGHRAAPARRRLRSMNIVAVDSVITKGFGRPDRTERFLDNSHTDIVTPCIGDLRLRGLPARLEVVSR